MPQQAQTPQRGVPGVGFSLPAKKEHLSVYQQGGGRPVYRLCSVPEDPTLICSAGDLILRLGE